MSSGGLCFEWCVHWAFGLVFQRPRGQKSLAWSWIIYDCCSLESWIILSLTLYFVNEVWWNNGGFTVDLNPWSSIYGLPLSSDQGCSCLFLSSVTQYTLISLPILFPLNSSGPLLFFFQLSLSRRPTSFCCKVYAPHKVERKVEGDKAVRIPQPSSTGGMAHGSVVR